MAFRVGSKRWFDSSDCGRSLGLSCLSAALSLHVCFREFLVATEESTYVRCTLRPAVPDVRISGGELPEMAGSSISARDGDRLLAVR